MPTSFKSRKSTRALILEGHGASRHLARILREELTSGRFGPGDKLPTHRALAQDYNVGYGVASRAMEILEREGLVQRQQGHGTFATEAGRDAPGTKRLDVLALVLGFPRFGFYVSLFQGIINSVAGELCRHTIVCDTEQDVSRQAMILMQLIDTRVAGIALVPTPQAATPACQVRVCQDMGIPVVLLHRDVKGVSAPLISLPFEEIGYRAGKALVNQNHRRVAFVCAEHSDAVQGYESGLRRAMEERGESLSDSLVYGNKTGTMSLPPELKKFLAETLDDILRLPDRDRPTAIVAIDEDDAEGIYMYLTKMGVHVPKQMSLITISSALRRPALDTEITAVAIDEVGVGRLAARLLAEMGRHERPLNDCGRFTAELSFRAGQTLGPAPPATERATSGKANGR